jgi:hypothetical protein
MSEESVENKINEYYKLKSKYEEENQKNIKKILNNKELSLKEKKNQYKQLKPKCINCGKPGGTTFASVINKNNNVSDQFRELRAFCKAVEPCGLNINIAVGNFDNINYFLKEIQDEINDSKKEIINDKNKLLFGLINTQQALDNFDMYKDNITDFAGLLEVYLQDYIKITDNAEIKQKLGEQIEKTYLYIQEIKTAIQKFNNTNDSQYVNDAVDIYITNLKPTLSELLNTKYKENMIWYDVNNGTYHLIQNKYTIKDMEVNIGKYETVVFDTSLQGSTPGAKKRQLLITSASSSASYDNDITPISVPVAIESSSPEDIIGTPIFNEDGSVAWSNKNYQTLWTKMSDKLQNALLTDKEWLQEFMNNCVKARLENKPCKFTNPSNLIIPPQILDDGKYDFGNTVYNDFFNKLSKGYQDTLLKIITEKDGVKNYDTFEYQIGTILANELEFGKGYFQILPLKPIVR